MGDQEYFQCIGGLDMPLGVPPIAGTLQRMLDIPCVGGTLGSIQCIGGAPQNNLSECWSCNLLKYQERLRFIGKTPPANQLAERSPLWNYTLQWGESSSVAFCPRFAAKGTILYPATHAFIQTK